MIFDAVRVEQMIADYRQSNSDELLESIVKSCEPLIRAIISTKDYPVNVVPDMVQECKRKIVMYGVHKYVLGSKKLHQYFTGIIINQCSTVAQKDAKYWAEIDEFVDLYEDDNIVDHSSELCDTHVLRDLISRNRRRFMSIDTETIDTLTKAIYDSLMAGMSDGFNKPMLGLSRKVVAYIHYSTVMYMRFVNYQAITTYLPDEFSKEADLMDLIGFELYAKLQAALGDELLKL